MARSSRRVIVIWLTNDCLLHCENTLKPIRITLVTLLIFAILVILLAMAIKPVESLEFSEILVKYAAFLPGNLLSSNVTCYQDYTGNGVMWYCTKEDSDALLFLYLNQNVIAYTHLYLKQGVTLGELKRTFGAWQRRSRIGRNTYWIWEDVRAYAYGQRYTTLFTPVRSITFL